MKYTRSTSSKLFPTVSRWRGKILDLGLDTCTVLPRGRCCRIIILYFYVESKSIIGLLIDLLLKIRITNTPKVR